MKQNMGSIDKAVRVGVALIIALMVWQKMLVGTPAVLLSILAVVFLVTSAVGFCPLYTLFGFNTCGVKTHSHREQKE